MIYYTIALLYSTTLPCNILLVELYFANYKNCLGRWRKLFVPVPPSAYRVRISLAGFHPDDSKSPSAVW